MKRHEFAVIGLGRFGSSLAETLVAMGHTVLGVERDPALVQRMADDLTQVVRVDSTDEDALREIDIASYPTVVVAIGQDFENALMTTVALKSLGVRHVVCKATTKTHRDVLLKVGADRVVLPEHEMGEQLAYQLTKPSLVGQIVGHSEHTVGEVRIGPGMAGRTVGEAGIMGRYGAQPLAILRERELVQPVSVNTKLVKGDLLVVVGPAQAISRLAEHA